MSSLHTMFTNNNATPTKQRAQPAMQLDSGAPYAEISSSAFQSPHTTHPILGTLSSTSALSQSDSNANSGTYTSGFGMSQTYNTAISEGPGQQYTPRREEQNGQRGSSRIAAALRAAERATTPPPGQHQQASKNRLDYMPQDNFPNYRESTPPPSRGPSQCGTPRDAPPTQPFANVIIQRPNTVEDSDPSNSENNLTPRVSEHGTPRSDATSKVFSAARHGKYHVVEDVLLQDDSAFDPEHSTDSHGNTLFHIACQNGNKKIAKLSIKYGGNMDKQNNRGNTGLHFLYQFGYAEIAEYFISKGANPNVPNKKGFICKQGFKGDVTVTF